MYVQSVMHRYILKHCKLFATPKLTRSDMIMSTIIHVFRAGPAATHCNIIIINSTMLQPALTFAAQLAL